MPRTSSGMGPVELLERRTLLSIIPVGGEFAVNTHTPSHQVWSRAATAADGSFVIVWASQNQAATTSDDDVFARRYAADGTPLTGEILVNTYTTSYQTTPAVAMDDAGNFVVVWGSFGQDGNATGIYAQRFNASAQRIGSEFRINTYTGGDEAYPAVAMDSDGDFVVTWDTYNPGAGALYDVYLQRFNAQGQPQGGEVRVNTTFASHEFASNVAMDPAGNFVVVWTAEAQDGSGHGVYAQRFSAAGARQGGEFRLNVYTAGNQLFPSVAMDADGDFVAAWQSDGQDGSGTAVVARRYSAGGAPAGDEFIVNSYTTAQQEAPAVAMDAAGNLIIVWESFGADQSLLGVRGRAFAADGAALGAEFGVNTHVVNDQAFAHVAMNATGDAVVVWQSRNQDGSDNGIFGQRYRLDTVAPNVSAGEYCYQTSPHLLKFTFSENVSSTLSTDDLTVVNLAGGPPVATALLGYDTATNTATFSFGGALDDGQYRATLASAGITDPAGNPLTADYVINFFFLLGDANHDGRVNLADFNILAANFGQSPRDFTQGDFNYDSIVNLADFNILASRFGQVSSTSWGGGGSFEGAWRVLHGRRGLPFADNVSPLPQERDDVLRTLLRTDDLPHPDDLPNR